MSEPNDEADDARDARDAARDAMRDADLRRDAEDIAKAATTAAELVAEKLKTVDTGKAYLQIVLAALIAAPGIITALRIGVTNDKVQETREAVAETHKMVNSRLTELLEISKKNSRAEGIAEGEKRGRSEAEAEREK